MVFENYFRPCGSFKSYGECVVAWNPENKDVVKWHEN